MCDNTYHPRMNLRYEIKQTKPFDDPTQEAYLGVVRTAAELEHSVAELLKPHGITQTQYNVLRILRGAGDDGLSRNQVRDRMIAPVPDATRLLDRLAAVGLIRRARDAADRRFVTTRITEAGDGLKVNEQGAAAPAPSGAPQAKPSASSSGAPVKSDG